MSSRPFIPSYPVVINGDMSGNITSLVTIVKMLSMVSYSVEWTGTTPVGEVVVEVSNDYSVNAAGSVSDAGIWNELTLSSICLVSGNSGNGFIDINQIAGYAMRLRYLRTSGTGTMQVVLNSKVS